MRTKISLNTPTRYRLSKHSVAAGSAHSTPRAGSASNAASITLTHFCLGFAMRETVRSCCLLWRLGSIHPTHPLVRDGGCLIGRIGLPANLAYTILGMDGQSPRSAAAMGIFFQWHPCSARGETALARLAVTAVQALCMTAAGRYRAVFLARARLGGKKHYQGFYCSND